jgi:hypothetical protein
VFVGDGVGDGIDRPDGHLGSAHRRERLVAGLAREPGADGFIDEGTVLDARGVGAKTFVLDHIGASDHLEDAPCHRPGRARQRDILALGAAIDVARRRCVGARADALLDDAGEAVDRGLRSEHGEHRFQERKIDHLTLALAPAPAFADAVPITRPQCRDHGEGAVEAGDHIGERERRQHRLAIRETGAGGKAAHRLDQRAEPRQRRVRPGLAETGDAHDDEAGIFREQHIGAEPDLLERPRAKILDQDVGGGDEALERVLGAVVTEVEHDRALVARVGLPVQLPASVAPVAQRVARGRLHLDDVGAEIGELERKHVAGDEPRQVEHAHTGERADRGGVE